jgi:hypothetical protein
MTSSTHTAPAAVTGAMYIAGNAVIGDAETFRAANPVDGTRLEPIRWARGVCG